MLFILRRVDPIAKGVVAAGLVVVALGVVVAIQENDGGMSALVIALVLGVAIWAALMLLRRRR